MAKLYWRVKKNGRWTWKPALVVDHVYMEGFQQYGKTVLLEDDEK